MPKTKAEKIAALEANLTAQKARLSRLKAQESAEERKRDTRRKIIAGALALEHYEKNPASEFAKVFGRLLDEYVTRPVDRVLFPPLPASSAQAVENKEPDSVG